MVFLRSNAIFLFFLALLFLVIIALLFFKPRGEVFVDTDNVDIAKIEMKDFEMHQIKKDITDVIIKGKEAVQYRDYEIFKDILVRRSLENNIIEDIKAKRVHRKDDVYSFFNGVDYQKSDGLSFVSQAGVLNLKTEVFTGKGKFELKNFQGIVEGLDIVYNKKKETIKAQKIKSKIMLEEQ